MIYKNKKGLSAVIATLMLILLTLVLVGVLWAVINGLVSDQTKNSENCFDIFNKIEINEQFTCYNFSDDTFLFSINVKDIDPDSIIVSVSGSGITKSYELEKDARLVSNNLGYFEGSLGGDIAHPGENSGRTYWLNTSAEGFSDKPTEIEIAPKMGGTQCDVVDSVSEIVSCTTLNF